MDFRVVLGIVLGIAALWVVLLVIFWALRPKGVSAKELVRIIPDVLRLLRSLIGDRSAPLDVRVVLVGLVAWIISPIDLIPEFIPVLGPLDDVVVAVVAMRYIRRRVGIEDLRARWVGTPDGFALLTRVIGHDLRLQTETLPSADWGCARAPVRRMVGPPSASRLDADGAGPRSLPSMRGPSCRPADVVPSVSPRSLSHSSRASSWPRRRSPTAPRRSGSPSVPRRARRTATAQPFHLGRRPLASDLVANDTNDESDVFVRDRQRGSTRRVSISSAEAQATGDSDDPSISADGRYVAFASFARNLVANDTNLVPDVFMRGPLQ